VEWFKTLPVYLDLPGLRVVHACWHRPSLDALAPYLDDRQCIREESWPEVAAKGSAPYEAAEVLLKGLEIALPSAVEFLDKDGNPRRHIRTRWWETATLTYRDLAIVPADVIERIPHTPIEEDILPGYDGEKPVFVGHYWLDGEPGPLAPHIACLDYSIARQDTADRTPGKLCAYRWDGEVSERLRQVPGIDTGLLGLLPDLADRHFVLGCDDRPNLLDDRGPSALPARFGRPTTPNRSFQLTDLPVHGRQFLALSGHEFLSLHLEFFTFPRESLFRSSRFLFLALSRKRVQLLYS
jgi:hypothetical protein